MKTITGNSIILTLIISTLTIVFVMLIQPVFLGLFIVGTYITMSATYYFSILRGIRNFGFLAQRNIISSIIKILVATILSFIPLGIIGVGSAI